MGRQATGRSGADDRIKHRQRGETVKGNRLRRAAAHRQGSTGRGGYAAGCQ